MPTFKISPLKCCLLLLILTGFNVHAQSIRVLTTRQEVSLRGLSVVSDKVVWASGNKGTVCRSTDGGSTWKWQSVPGFEKNDFRDIEAFDSLTAVVMAVADPAYILKTTDGGITWKKVYENHTKGMFLDAMDFSNTLNGIVVGDPLSNRFFMASTSDGGNTWQEISCEPAADQGEACFASSGTNLRLNAKGHWHLITGGVSSRFHSEGSARTLPMLQGKESTGANSLAFKNRKIFVVVGGNFMAPASDTGNCALTSDGGKTWVSPRISPHGYRSCVEYLQKNEWVSCGLTGVDISSDNGKTWQLISNESFHVCRKAKNGKSVFLAGNGKIGKMETR